MKGLEAMQKAQDALSGAGVSVPVLVRGQPDPGEGEVVILDYVSSTPYGYDQVETTRLQVGVYASTHAEALALAETLKDPLESAGLHFEQQQAAPGDDPGVVMDWRV